jgi:hypothetical protein
MKPNPLIIGTLVPTILVGHVVVFEEYCEPHCDWWHPPHVELSAGSSRTMVNSLVMPTAFQTTSS